MFEQLGSLPRCERLLQAANKSRAWVRVKTELALQQLVANEMQRQIDQAGLNLEVMVYKPLDTLVKPFLTSIT